MRLGPGKLLVKCCRDEGGVGRAVGAQPRRRLADRGLQHELQGVAVVVDDRHEQQVIWPAGRPVRDPKLGRSEETRLNSSHVEISYAVFCLKKKKKPYSEV